VKILFSVAHYLPGAGARSDVYRHEFESDFVPRVGDVLLLPDASHRPVEAVIIRWDLSDAVVWIRFEGDQPSWTAFVDGFPQFVHMDPELLHDPYAGVKPVQQKNDPVP